jgi:phosphoribosylanthranilate isomerase
VTRIKICGVTSIEQALACVDLGAHALGVNLIDGSPRRVELGTARAITEAVGARALVVAVVANWPLSALRDLRARTGVGCLQLHGDESPDDVAALLPHAYKAVRVADASDVAIAEAMPGEYVLVDAKVHGALGGTGHALEWGLVVDLAKRRRLALAGGLHPWTSRAGSRARRAPRISIAFAPSSRRCAKPTPP